MEYINPYTGDIPMIITLSGPSGIGKGFLTDALSIHLGAHVVPWVTTRSTRPDTVESNRIFVSEEEFSELTEADKLIGIQHLHGASYGLRSDYLVGCSGSMHICEINAGHAKELFPYIGDRFSIALIAEDRHFLRQRITGRDLTISKFEVADRLERAQVETESIIENQSLFHLVYSVSKDTEGQVVTTALEAIKKETNNDY